MSRTSQQVQYDVYNDYGNDLVVSPTGDLLLSTGVELSNQRILRRLLTAINGYIWDSSYGAGLPGYIGQPLTADVMDKLTSTIRSQIFLEDTVAKTPFPEILLQPIPEGLFCQINYTYAQTKEPIVLTFTV